MSVLRYTDLDCIALGDEYEPVEGYSHDGDGGGEHCHVGDSLDQSKRKNGCALSMDPCSFGLRISGTTQY